MSVMLNSVSAGGLGAPFSLHVTLEAPSSAMTEHFGPDGAASDQKKANAADRLEFKKTHTGKLESITQGLLGCAYESLSPG